MTTTTRILRTPRFLLAGVALAVLLAIVVPAWAAHSHNAKFGFFTVKSSIAGQVALNWETVSAENLAGFNVYRAQATEAWTKVNPALIVADAPTDQEVHRYSWTDTRAEPGITYYYRLEDVDRDGVSTQSEPQRVVVARSTLLGAIGGAELESNFAAIVPALIAAKTPENSYPEPIRRLAPGTKGPTIGGYLLPRRRCLFPLPE
jgi:hypothetical protein